MKKLQPPAEFHVKAAQGWLELGNAAEAMAELRQVPPGMQEHPRVIHEWWQVHGHLGDYPKCLELARHMIQVAPHLSWGWFMQSWTLFCQGKPEVAYESLLPSADRFPKDKLVRYELACYACKLGRIPEAKKWLSQAAEVSDAAAVQEKASADPKLQPLWEWLSHWPVKTSRKRKKAKSTAGTASESRHPVS
jgi:tetratricopeptide (TPR) repeat protein